MLMPSLSIAPPSSDVRIGPGNADAHHGQPTNLGFGLTENYPPVWHRRMAKIIDIPPRVAAPEKNFATIRNERVSIIRECLDLIACTEKRRVRFRQTDYVRSKLA
jgi:hypothetical protein